MKQIDIHVLRIAQFTRATDISLNARETGSLALGSLALGSLAYSFCFLQSAVHIRLLCIPVSLCMFSISQLLLFKLQGLPYPQFSWTRQEVSTRSISSLCRHLKCWSNATSVYGKVLTLFPSDSYELLEMFMCPTIS